MAKLQVVITAAEFDLAAMDEGNWLSADLSHLTLYELFDHIELDTVTFEYEAAIVTEDGQRWALTDWVAAGRPA